MSYTFTSVLRIRSLLAFFVAAGALCFGCTRSSWGEEGTIAASADAETSVRPGINDRFLDPDLDPEEWLARFEVESREVFRHRDAIVAACDVVPGETVADVGAGTGLFTRLFSDAVGLGGGVFAADISPKMIEHIVAISEEGPLANVTPVLCGARDVMLPRASCDVVFLCDTYHHFEYPSQTLASIREALKEDGRLILIDFERIEGVSSDWTMGHVRAGRNVFRREIESAGFRLQSRRLKDVLNENYMLVFRKQGRARD